MEANELDEVSADDLDLVDGDDTSEEDVEGDDTGDLISQFVQPCFERWIEEIAPTIEQGELLREIFSRVTIIARDVEVVSSERNWHVDFELYSIQCRYRQCSQADATSPVWDASQGTFDLKPNVEAELELDGETLATCRHYAGDAVRPINDDTEGSASASGRSRRYVNEERFSEYFGTETIVKLGGSKVLMQFFGILCVDPAAPCYTEMLPFHLISKLLAVNEGIEEYRRRVPKAPTAGSPRSSVSPRKKISKAGQPVGYPATAVPPKDASSVQPTAPPTRPTGDHGPTRPRVGASKSSAAPKRQSSHSRKVQAAAPR
jgi:hypothetical protein